MGGSRSPAWAWFDGRLVPFDEARVPLEDRGLQFGESLYEVVALVEGEAFRLPDHVARMARGAGELGLHEGVPALPEWYSIAGQLYRREPHRSAILYAQVTGGTAPRRHVPAERRRPLFFAYLRAFEFPDPGTTAHGITVITVPETRWRRRDLKTTMLLPAVVSRREAADRGAEEAIYIGQDGFVNEGASSNVFVSRGRGVVTPPATNRLLAGVSTIVVREICNELQVPFETHPVTLSDLASADEVFVASTTFLLMPVTCLDGRLIGGGKAGPVSLQLAYHFQKRFWAVLDRSKAHR
ncbi:MAG: aminotransferase class IV [Acidobacteriota bacterium]